MAVSRVQTDAQTLKIITSAEGHAGFFFIRLVGSWLVGLYVTTLLSLNKKDGYRQHNVRQFLQSALAHI